METNQKQLKKLTMSIKIRIFLTLKRPTPRMNKIIYTSHLKLRLNVRKISYDYPKMILNNPERRFFDILEKRNIAIKRLKYNKKIRNMMVAYENKGDFMEIITIHPISEEKIINRVRSGRWK